MKKRILSVLLTLCMVLSLVPAAALAADGGLTGTGTAEDPYLIYTAEDLKQFRDMVNGGNTDICAKLMNDIVLNDGTFDENGNWSESGTPDQWTPIGDSSNPYGGTFDGGGHTIRGLYVKGAGNAGLFGYIYQGAVKNVAVTGYVEGTLHVGGIVGYGYGATVIGCTNAATVKGGFSHVGGIVGWLIYDGNVRNCANLGSVWAQIDSERENAYVGGIAGFVKMSETIADCYNAGSIAIQDSGTEKEGNVSYLGGIIGVAQVLDYPCYISNCYSVGSLTYRGSASTEIYGIAGDATACAISRCYWLEGTAESGVGGNPYQTTDITAKTGAEFADGTVLALLKGDRTDSPWGECGLVEAVETYLHGFAEAVDMILPLLSWQTAHTHTWEGEWRLSKNPDGHFHKCTGCNAATDYAAHSPVAGNCTWGIYCVCGYPLKTFESQHNWSDWEHDVTTHTRKCLNPYCTVVETNNCTGGTATCTEQAVCDVCGGEYGATDPGNHIGGVLLVGVKEPTCTEGGYTGDEVCASCDAIVTPGETVPATGHDLERTGEKAPTCTEDGYTGDEVCKTCGETVTQGETVPATGHDPERTGEKAPTCTEDGYTGDEVCKTCGEIVTKGEAIPATGHDPERTGEKAPTCTQDGYTGDEVCKTCGETVTQGETVPATGHDPELTGEKAPTCTEDGYTGDEVCKTCGETVTKGETVPATGHNYKDGKCAGCGAADPDYKPAVRTGDHSAVTLWAALLPLTALLAALTIGRKKRLS